MSPRYREALLGSPSVSAKTHQPLSEVPLSRSGSAVRDSVLPEPEYDDVLDSKELEELLEGGLDAVVEAKKQTAPGSERARHPVEMSLVVLANLVWGVAGLMLWIPVLVRTFLLSVTGLVHGALTGQRPLATAQRIRRASRFYADPFLRSGQFESPSGARQTLRLPQLLFEVLWAAFFYTVVLWLAGVLSFSPRAFGESAWRLPTVQSRVLQGSEPICGHVRRARSRSSPSSARRSGSSSLCWCCSPTSPAGGWRRVGAKALSQLDSRSSLICWAARSARSVNPASPALEMGCSMTAKR